MIRKYNDKLIDSIIIFLAGLVLFTYGLNHQEIISFESRFYLFALEMWRHGVTWFPTTYQKPYPDYPVTATLLIYGLAKMAGVLNRAVAILPSAIAAALTLVVTYLIGALQSRRWGGFAVVFLMLTIMFVMQARTISLDEYITLMTAASFYMVYSAKQLNIPARRYWVFLFIILGFVFRGPIGLVVPTGVVCVFYLLEKNYKQFFVVGMIAALILNACLTLLVIMAYHTGGFEFVQNVLGMQVVSRMADAKSPPLYFYFVENFSAYAVTFPLLVLMVPGVLARFFKSPLKNETKFLLYLLGWVLIVMVGLSLPSDKKTRYILPIAPALALFCAYLFAGELNFYLRYLRNLIYLLCGFLPILLAGLVYFFSDKLVFMQWSLGAFISVLAVLQLFIFVIYYSAKQRDFFILVIAALSFMLSYINIIEPINFKYNQTKEFVTQIEKLRKEHVAQLVFYHEDPDGLVIKYFIDTPNEVYPHYVNERKRLVHYPQAAFFITSEEYYDKLPFSIKNKFAEITHGKIGHDKVVVFCKNSVWKG